MTRDGFSTRLTSGADGIMMEWQRIARALVWTSLWCLVGCNPPGALVTNPTTSVTLVPKSLPLGMAVYPGPQGSSAYLSSLYAVEVYDGTTWQPSYTYEFTRASKTPWHSGNPTPTVNFTTFATAGVSQVRVTRLSGAITAVSVSPLSKGLAPTPQGNQVTFSLNQHDKVWITFNNDDANPLFVFADGPEPVLPTGTGNLLYFGPGVTTINQYQATSGEVIYLDGGAVVRGNISVKGTTNVQIVGAGILSGDLWTGETIQGGGLSWAQETGYAMVTGDFNSSDGATVTGITLLDAPFYHFYGGASKVIDVKELSPWYWSTDGFQGVIDVENCFAFVGDNVFFPVWAPLLQANVTILHSFAGTTNNAVFSGGFWGFPTAALGFSSLVNDIDVKTYTVSTWGTHTPAIFQIWVDNNSATSGFSNQTYENVRIEGNLSSDMAELMNFPYPWPGAQSYTPALGNSSNFQFTNVTLAGTQSQPSVIQGYDPNNGFHNVTWTNLSINGTVVTSANAAQYFTTNGYVWGLTFQ